MKPLTLSLMILLFLPIALATITIPVDTSFAPSAGGNFTFLTQATASNLSLQDDGLTVNLSSDANIRNIGATKGNLTIASDIPRNIYNTTGLNFRMIAKDQIDYTLSVDAGESYGIGCVVPVSNMTVYNDTTFCSGTYYLNATSSSTGAVTIGADNVDLDCNGATIISNTTGNGIYSKNYKNMVIENCNLYNYNRGIYIQRNSGTETGVIIKNSLINNSIADNILILAIPNTLIDNVTSINAGSHALYFSQCSTCGLATNQSVTNSNLSYSASDCLQYNSLNLAGRINGGEVYNNYIGQCGANAINNIGAMNLNISNNIIENPNHRGIALYYDLTSTAPYNTSAINNTIMSNNFLDVTNAYYIGNFSSNNTIKDNTYSQVPNIYMREYFDININETSSVQHIINLSNNGVAYFNYNGRKDLRVENNTIIIQNMPTSFNQIFQTNQTAPLYENINKANWSVNAGNTSFVFNQQKSTDAHPIDISQNITEMQISQDSNAYYVNCTGTGNHTHTNLPIGENGYTNVFHNGVFVGISKGIEYTANGCSDWYFQAAPAAQIGGGSSTSGTTIGTVCNQLGSLCSLDSDCCDGLSCISQSCQITPVIEPANEPNSFFDQTAFGDAINSTKSFLTDIKNKAVSTLKTTDIGNQILYYLNNIVDNLFLGSYELMVFSLLALVIIGFAVVNGAKRYSKSKKPRFSN